MDIIVIKTKIDQQILKDLTQHWFRTLVKFVVDIRTAEMAVGGELHSDAEQLLLERGSKQSDLWGGNFFPGKPEESQIEYTSLINIRPNDNNNSMEIEDDVIRKSVENLVKLYLKPNEDGLA